MRLVELQKKKKKRIGVVREILREMCRPLHASPPPRPRVACDDLAVMTSAESAVSSAAPQVVQATQVWPPTAPRVV